MAQVSLLSLHTSPLAQPGTGDSGGMNVYVRELAAGLAHGGHDCTVYVRSDRPGLPARVPVEPGVTVAHLPAGPLGLAKEDLPSVVDEWADRVAEAIDTGGGTDVLHSNYWLSGMAGHRLKHELDRPLVSTFHTLARVKGASGDPEPEERARAEAAVMACSDAVLASCPAEAHQIVAHYGVPPARIALVAPGVERALFSPGPRAAARAAVADLDLGERPMLLLVGRIQRLKGIDVAVDALTQMRTRDATLVVCGGPSGPEGEACLDEVRAQVAAHGLGDRVRIVSPRPHHELSSLYRAADVVVVPSRSESFGLVALEAAACGRPVVASAVGGLATLVDHRQTGLLLTRRDPADWAAALDGLLAAPHRAARLGRAAAVASRRYRWARAAGDLAAVYAEVTGRPPLDCAA
ncbi:MAG: glycosyltransferase [Iamia sp.]